MKYIGIDYGEKRIGLAVSDERGVFAFPEKTIEGSRSSVEQVSELIKAKEVGGIVIGVPTTYSGEKNEVEKDIRTFAAQLQEQTGIVPTFENEQFSSREATRFAPGEKKDDAVSAAVILQRYLDARPQER